MDASTRWLSRSVQCRTAWRRALVIFWHRWLCTHSGRSRSDHADGFAVSVPQAVRLRTVDRSALDALLGSTDEMSQVIRIVVATGAVYLYTKWQSWRRSRH